MQTTFWKRDSWRTSVSRALSEMRTSRIAADGDKRRGTPLYERLFPVPNEWRGMGAHKAGDSDVKHRSATTFLLPRRVLRNRAIAV